MQLRFERAGQLAAAGLDDVADGVGAGAEVFVFDDVEHGVGGRAGDGIAGIGAAEAAGTGRVHDVGAAGDGGERQAAGETLGERDDVGLDARVLEREQLAGAGEAGLDLVGDEDDAVLVAERAQRVQEIGRRDVEAAFALHRLDDDAGDRRRVGLILEDRLEGLQALGRRGAVIEVREGDVVDVGREGTEALLVGHGLAGQRHAHVRAAVEAAGERDDAGTAGEAARDLDGVLDRFGAGGGQHRLGGPGDGCDGVQPLGERDVVLVRRHLKADVAEALELLLIAARMRGCWWPVLTTAMPAAKSM